MSELAPDPVGHVGDPGPEPATAASGWVGMLAGAGVAAMGAWLWTSDVAVHGAVRSVAAIAVSGGALGVIVGVGCVLTGRAVVWRQSLSMMLMIGPMLTLMPVAAGLRVLGPAIGSLAAVPIVLAPSLDAVRPPSSPAPGSAEASASSDRVVMTAGRSALWVTLLSAALGSALVILREPFLDPACDEFCGHNPWAVQSAPTVITLFRLMLGSVTMIWCWCRWIRPDRSYSRPDRSDIGETCNIVAVLGIGVGMVGQGIGIIGQVPVVVIGCGLAALLLVLAVALKDQVTMLATRRAIHLLTTDMAAHGRAGQVQEWLRHTVRDESLTVHFPPLPSASGRTITPVVRATEVIAGIEHRAASATRLAKVLTPVVAMAIDNDRLNALAQAQYDSLVRSRRQIVRKGDAARQRLERDLHDGAQQRILLLGMILTENGESPNADYARARRAGVALAARALSELRSITNGVAPPILDQLGLMEAVRALTDTSALPVAIVADLCVTTLPQDVERAAYRVIASTLRQASHTGADHATVTITRTADLSVSIEHNGSPPVDTVDADDRMGALRGHHAVSSEASSVVVRVVLPCG